MLRSLGGRIDSVLEEEREKEREKAKITGRKRRRIKVRRSGGPQTSVIPSGPVTATSEDEPTHESQDRTRDRQDTVLSDSAGEDNR